MFKPVGSIAGLAAVGSPSPVVWTTMLVSDCDKIGVVLPDAIDEAVWESGNQPLAVSTLER